MSMPERDTMRLRNKYVVGSLFFMLLSATFFWGTQQTNQPQQDQHVQATPIPSDIDPSDPALPVWAKPATPTASSAKPVTPGNIPPNQPQQPGQDSTAGAVTKD